MKVELIYHLETGTVLSAITRVSGIDDDAGVEALVGPELHLRSPWHTESLALKPESLGRFTVDADEQLDQLMFDPWAFGVQDKALVSYAKTMAINWDAGSTKFEVQLMPAPSSDHLVVFLVRRPTHTEVIRRTVSAFTATTEAVVAGAKWALVLASGYRTRASDAS